MIEAALFDIDGTLIDSVDAHAKAWTIAFGEHGVEAAFEDVRRQIGKGADKLLPVFLDEAVLDTLGKRIDARQAEIFKTDYLGQIRPFPGVRTLFERLKTDGVKRVLATSGKPEDVSAYKEIANITDLVDTGATSQDASQSKPAPGIVKAALWRIAPTPPSLCVFIGDTPYDAEAATRAGVLTIGLLSGGFDEAVLRQAGCRLIFRDIADLLGHYDTLLRLPE